MTLALWAAVPRAVFACPVCFGQSDSPLALGINYGIFVMLGLIAVLWVAFGSFFLYLKRRVDLVAAASDDVRGVPLQPDHQEGTI